MVACKIKKKKTKKPKILGLWLLQKKKETAIYNPHTLYKRKIRKKIVLPDAFDAILLREPDEDDDGCSARDTARFSDLISTCFAPLVAAVPPEDDFETPLALDDFLEFDDAFDAVVICEGGGV